MMLDRASRKESFVNRDQVNAMLERLKEVQPEELPEKLIEKHDELKWFEPEERERSRKLALVDLPAKAINCFLEEMPVGGSSDLHRHYHEAIHFVISGKGYTEIQGRRVEWEAGDFFYIPPWTWHRHFNTQPEKPVKMLGIENSRLLERMGNIRRIVSVGQKSFADIA
jgi:mannose-6-phosphate isomerase-like protein (cupin superfamily)